MGFFPKKSVLVPVDFSPASLAAVEVAQELVDQKNHLHLVYVIPELHPAEPAEIWSQEDKRQRTAEQKLRDVAPAGSQVHVQMGDAGRKICELSEEIGAELIVIPSHGRHGLLRLLLGSVAERVLRLAKCEVLVLRAHDSENDGS